ncbi:hypothetical protein CIK05_02500 [Bdellovibrio sp. qaytius]|nr:hypothetical protein CIK05_02500 [Bdellovibrio sp. qaytius]
MVTSGVSGYYIFKPGQRATNFSDRAPASIKPVEIKVEEPAFFSIDEVKKPTPFETTISLDCQELFSENSKISSASVSSDHVILKLSHCSKQFNQVKNIDLINKTNGYNAQLFKLSKTQFNSDFIQLDKGVNQLEFEISLNDGQKKLQIFKIQRVQ